MIDYANHKGKLLTRISQAKDAKRPQAVLSLDDNCEHVWDKFKQTIIPERADVYPPLPEFAASTAYFIVKACTKCKTKRNVDYVVER